MAVSLYIKNPKRYKRLCFIAQCLGMKLKECMMIFDDFSMLNDEELNDVYDMCRCEIQVSDLVSVDSIESLISKIIS